MFVRAALLYPGKLASPCFYFVSAALVYTAKQNAKNFQQIFPEKEYRGLSPNFHIHVSVSELYTVFPRWVCLFCRRKYVDQSWEFISRSGTHKCGNCGWGHAIPQKGIHKPNCRCSVPWVTGVPRASFLSMLLCYILVNWCTPCFCFVHAALLYPGKLACPVLMFVRAALLYPGKLVYPVLYFVRASLLYSGKLACPVLMFVRAALLYPGKLV
jgi:hypothetical protein